MAHDTFNTAVCSKELLSQFSAHCILWY